MSVRYFIWYDTFSVQVIVENVTVLSLGLFPVFQVPSAGIVNTCSAVGITSLSQVLHYRDLIRAAWRGIRLHHYVLSLSLFL